MYRSRTPFLVLLVLLFLVSAAALLLHFGVLAPEEEPETSDVLVSALPADQIVSIQWSGGDLPSFTLERDSQGLWSSPECTSAALDQSKTASVVSALCQVVSSREIRQPEDLSAYGLEPPQREVRLTLSDGQTVTYFLGSLNSYNNRYYLQTAQSGSVYLVGYSVGQSMRFNILDYAALPDPPALSTDFLVQLTLQSERGLFQVVRDASDQTGAHLWRSLSGDVSSSLEEEQLQLLSQLNALSFDICVSLSPTAEELARWGLDIPSTLEAVYRPDTSSGAGFTLDQLTFRLYVGGENDASQYYIQTEENGPVYLMSAAPLQALFTLLP